MPALRDYSGALSLSVIGHILLLLLFSFNLVFVPHEPAPLVKLAIEATVVDSTAVPRDQRREQQRQIEQQRMLDEQRRAEEQRRKEEQQKLEQQRREQEAERIRLEQDRQRKVEDQQRKEEQARLEEQRRKQEQARQAEQQRKEEEARLAEQKRKEEEARQAEQRRKEEAERERVAAEKARQAEIQQQMADDLAAEEQRRVAVESGLLARYIALISNRVERNWAKPASAKPGLNCDVYVTQIPGGEVVNVRIGTCNGDAAVMRSIEAAVYRSSPLPTPDDPSLFDRNLRFRFKPEE